MNAQRASAPVRFVRLAAALVLIGLAAVVAARLAGRRGGPPASPVPSLPPPAGGIVDLQERVRQQEFKDGRAVADIRGESFFRGPDGRNHLRGAVEFAGFGPGGETVSRLSADEVVYDPGSLRFTVAGHVRVEAGGVVLEGDAFEYDKAAGLFETTRGGRFSSKTMSGSAPEIAYADAADEIRLGGGFRAEIRGAEPAGTSLVISGTSLVYSRRGRQGRVGGPAEFRGAGFRAASTSLSFVASADEGGLASAGLDGAARLVLTAKRGSGEGGGEIRAGRIAAVFGPGSLDILSLEASGEAVLSWPLASGGEGRLRAPGIAMAFGPAGELNDWRASGGIEAEIQEGEGTAPTIIGDAADFDAATGVLQVRSRPGRPAVAESPEIRMESDAIAADTAARTFTASGAVRTWLRTDETVSPATGLFASDGAVSVTSGGAVLEEKARRVAFSGQVRAWQGAETIRADELEFDRGTGDIRGRGAIEVSLDRALAPGAAASEDRTVALGGRALDYRAGPRTLTLTGKASVRLTGAGLEAGSVTAVLARDGRGVESLSAAKEVIVFKGAYVGRSEAGTYAAATDRIILTGRPVLTDGKGGSARGAKLTFDLADDKIFIENEGSGRATTVVRS